MVKSTRQTDHFTYYELTKLSFLLPGIKLHDQASPSSIKIPKDTALRVQCFVNPSLIPLYARAGPTCEFYATNRDTLKWIKSKLLSNDVALLLHVEGSTPTVVGRCVISDFLVYGILSRQQCLPPTLPPEWPDHHQRGGARKELKIYATPLSDNLVAKAQALPSPPSTPRHHRDHNAEFVELPPDIHSPNTAKRKKRVDTFFEAAEQHHRGVQRKGGQAVSQLMAKAHPHPNPHIQSQVQIKQEPQEQSTLLSSSLLQPQQARHEQDLEMIITTNKNLLTRTILTCMRLYGYTRRSNKTPFPGESAAATRECTPTPGFGSDEDEFKAMYHATYRAAMFALRRYIKSSSSNNDERDVPVLTKEKATTLVDEILRLFCEDG